jgi:hypothetical protein
MCVVIRLVRAYVAFLAGVLTLIGIGVVAANGLWPAATVHPAHPSSKMVFDADYVQGLGRLGIVKLPAYEPPAR